MEKTIARYWKVLACACALAMCLALSACGGGSASSSASVSAAGDSASASASVSAVSVDPAEKFVGDWKMAAAEMQGLMVTGDFSSELFGEGIDITLNLAADGTGSMAFNDEQQDMVWELNGEDAITLKAADQTDGATEAQATYEDGVLALILQDDEVSGTMYLSHDGTMEGVRVITPGDALEFSSADDLAGTWKLTGVNMMGMSMYGNADDLAAAIGQDAASTTLEFNEDGTASFMGQQVTWAVDADGASVEMSGETVPLKNLDGDVMIDLASILGQSDLQMVMLFSK